MFTIKEDWLWRRFLCESVKMVTIPVNTSKENCLIVVKLLKYTMIVPRND